MRTTAVWAGAEYGRIALGGDSAGGNLAAAAALSLAGGAAGERPAFLTLVYPVLDASMGQPSYAENAQAFPIGAADMEWFLDHYVAEADRRDVRVAPLRSPLLAQLPPTHLVAAGHDPLRDEAIAFADAAREAKVPVSLDLHPSLCHGFLRFTAVSAAARTARDRLVDRIGELAGSVDTSSRLTPQRARKPPSTG
jgi:acetyl esterase